MDLGLKGKVAFVSGGSRGMGLGIARELAAEGVRVALASRGGPSLEEAVASITSKGGTAIGITADLGTKEGTIAAVQATRDAFGPPDIAISMAYYISPESGEGATPGRNGFENATDEQFRRTLDDFVMSVVHLTREVIPHMREQRWGRLINIGSVAMKVPHHEDQMVLANLRQSVCGLIKSLANEYGPYGITANVIAPGPVDSPSFNKYVAELPEYMNTKEKWAEQFVPIGRVGTIQDAGALATFLASERAGWITGQTILMDGGYAKTLF